MSARDYPYLGGSSVGGAITALQNRVDALDAASHTPQPTQGAAQRPELGGSNRTTIGGTNSASLVVMVPAPQSSTYRIIYQATLYNPHATDAAPDTFIQLYNAVAGDTRVVHRQLALAAKTSLLITWQGGLVLLDQWQLQIKLAGVPSSQLDWSCSFADPG